MEYREEWKYLCTDADLDILRHRLARLLPMDRHQHGSCYHVRSLYFDTWDERFFYENEAGVDARSKYRIRIYNCSDQKISFEIKEKLKNKTKKISAPLSREECTNYINGICPAGTLGTDAVKNRIYLMHQTDRIHPLLIVDYERTAYTYPAGNVRITFDRNLAASTAVEQFFDPALPLIPILPPHQHILEIKFDELLPDFIAQALELNSLRRTALSKYYLGREATYNHY